MTRLFILMLGLLAMPAWAETPAPIPPPVTVLPLAVPGTPLTPDASAGQLPSMVVPDSPPVMPTTVATPAPLPPVPQATPAGTPLPAGAVEITADEAVEWQRQQRLYTARGHAVARRGDVNIAADTLQAAYDDTAGKTKFTTVTADGNVVITSIGTDTRTASPASLHPSVPDPVAQVAANPPKQPPVYHAYGDHAVYDVDKQVATLTGQNLQLTSDDSLLTARDSIEFWQAQNLAIARGNAIARRNDGNSVAADVLSAHFASAQPGDTGPNAKRSLDQINAEGHVVIRTPTDTVTGSHAVYKAGTQVAVVTGGVLLARGVNRLQGQWAEVNLKTGISRLYAANAGSDTGGDGRVRGVFLPASQRPATSGPDAKGTKPQ